MYNKTAGRTIQRSGQRSGELKSKTNARDLTNGNMICGYSVKHVMNKESGYKLSWSIL